MICFLFEIILKQFLRSQKKGGKGAKEEEPAKKEWSDLKKRGEVDEEEEKDIFIDDEPDDGPSHYTLLIGFSEANLLRKFFKLSSVLSLSNYSAIK